MGRIEGIEELADKINDPLSLPRKFYEKMLRSLELLPEQIETQSFEELDKSLERVDDTITNSQQFGTLKIKMTTNGPIIAQQNSDYNYEMSILPLLLESKKIILGRKKLLTNNQKIESLQRIVETTADPDQLKEEIKNKLNSDEIKQIDKEIKETERLQLSAQANELLLMKKTDVENFKLKNEIFKSYLEKESVATIIGALLLIIITLSELICVFWNIKPSDIVNNAFLLILGYFFGQTISKKENR